MFFAKQNSTYGGGRQVKIIKIGFDLLIFYSLLILLTNSGCESFYSLIRVVNPTIFRKANLITVLAQNPMKGSQGSEFQFDMLEENPKELL